jgi:hypothetical protein
MTHPIVDALDTLLRWATDHNEQPFNKETEGELAQLDAKLYALCQRERVTIPTCTLSANCQPFGASGLPFHRSNKGMTVHVMPAWEQAMGRLRATVLASPKLSTLPLDPDIQAILARAEAKERQTQAHQLGQFEADARCRRAHEAWLRLSTFRDRAIPDDLRGEALTQRFAELIVDLGRVLKSDGWQERIDAVQADTDIKRYALAMLRKAMEGDTAMVTAMLCKGNGPFWNLGLPAAAYLRGQLMNEVLGIEPAPEPPAGWEGSYLQPVESIKDFVRWIDRQLDLRERLGGSNKDHPSSGELVRNAGRLVVKLGLQGMPLEPIGPFTLNSELGFLRNLRRLCSMLTSPQGTPARDNQTTVGDGEDDGAGRDQGAAELDRLAEGSSSSVSEAIAWCAQALDCIKSEVARRGNDWNAESPAALRLTLAAFRHAAALGADSAILSQVQVPPVGNICGPPTYSPMTGATGLQKLQVFAEWCANKGKTAEEAGARRNEGKAGQAQGRDPGEAEQAEAAAPSAEFVFAPSGKGYDVRGFGEAGHLAGYKGLTVLARLIATPAKSVPMLELIGADQRLQNDRRSTQPSVDTQGLRNVEEQLWELQADLTKAERENNTVEADSARQQIAELEDYLAAAKGRGGKIRDLNNPLDKLRSRIHGQLGSVYKAMREANPPMSELANHFELSIFAEGGDYMYRPAGAPPPWKAQPAQ